MRLSLRAGERIYINGAVLRVDRKVSIELLNDATFLLESHVLQVEEATTPLRQLYFAAQTMLIDPARIAAARSLYDGIRDGLMATIRDPGLREGLEAAHGFIEAGRLYEALKQIRGLYPTEALLLSPDDGPVVPVPALGALARRTRGPERPRERPSPGSEVRRSQAARGRTPQTLPALDPEA
ncbi:flagellar biosynthesis repressor FlbT [Methylobacterium terricola]|uniref:Probable flagellum biosynthesis repressor protein FlbT n=1 Tax=Methylobacterium terricola TaxID=2583531 RepID=A0A5C4LBM1_9HYPH|nr:flagellar biosynthesis repressor FlbT [Methylobacterium terricola]TNC08624.1 flagellar biosynthesis repressor FlbT [Methylobacterium terricola]